MELLTRFMHIVHAQPFDNRKNWFYENLYKGKPPSNELTLATQANVIEVDRGILNSYGYPDNVYNTFCPGLSTCTCACIQRIHVLYLSFILGPIPSFFNVT